MTLTLRIRNLDRLDNGMPIDFVLHRRGAVIGRSPTCDWSLPDPRNYVSSRHCEVTFADGFYTLTDISMNGTLLNSEGARMAAPRQIANGDVFIIGHYEVVASLTGEAIAAVERGEEAAAAASQSNWGGWDSHAGAAPAPAVTPGASDWGAPSSDGWATPTPVPSGPSAGWAAPIAAAPRGNSFGAPAPSPPAPVSSGWAPSANISPPPVDSTWEKAPPPPDPASGWSSAAPDRPPEATPDDIWGRIAEGNVVDWARGGFGSAPEAPRGDPLGLEKADPLKALGVAASAPVPASAPVAADDQGWGAPPSPAAPAAARPAAPPIAAPPPPPAAPIPAVAIEGFLRAVGIDPSQVKEPAPALLERAGNLFRRLVSGMVVMAEARARAKSQMGAEATSFAFDGNNPIKFARTPEEAMVALLNPPVRGFMEGSRAIEDAFFDLQSHQMATLKAMQGALRATLDRFSPSAIEKRAETLGLFQKIMPGARDAGLWQAYVREFGGVAQGSDEAFMDVFAKEFRKAYEEQAANQKRG